jgi:hypothetical protein
LGTDTTFVDAGANLPGAQAAYWGDYNNDGALDLLLVGGSDSTEIQYSAIFRNDSGVFHDSGVRLIKGVAAAWGDYDNDGYLDIAITGAQGPNDSGPLTKIYHNDQHGHFVDIGANLMGLGGGTVSWVDYNNDGYLDLVVMGSPDNGNTFYTKIYRNDKGTFTDINTNLPGIWGGSSMAWGDYNNDGRPDLFVTGWGGSPVTSIFRNDGPESGGGWTFTDIGASLPLLSGGEGFWFDYNNDGYLDLFVTGAPSGSYASQTYLLMNDGHGNFIQEPNSFEPTSRGFATPGDFNGDGYLDIAFTGGNDFFGDSLFTKIYRNDHGFFTDLHAAIPGFYQNSTMQWGDFDNDGDLDLLIAGPTTGYGATDFRTMIYRNTAGTNTYSAHLPPSAPTNLQSQVSKDSIKFTWNKSTASQSPQAALSYNFYVGTDSNNMNIASPMSDSTGFRKVVQLGNAFLDTTWTIMNPGVGTYYWGVQAVDNAYAGSPFSVRGAILDTLIPPGPNPRILSVKDVPFDQGGRVSVTWRASTRDTNVDMLQFYSVWRSLAPESVKIALKAPAVRITSNFHGTAYRTKTVGDTVYAWEWLENLPAHRLMLYSCTAPTLNDSMSGNNGMAYFMVSAQTSDPNVFFDSNIDSGSSVDNTAPLPPGNPTAMAEDHAIVLQWDRSIAPDLAKYAVFRSTSPISDVTGLSPYAFTSDTSYTDGALPPSGNLYYVIKAQDIHGNLSGPSAQIIYAVTGVKMGEKGMPVVYRLYPNYPNPFNPTTQIVYDLPSASFVRLTVYNTLGQVVTQLVNGIESPGTKTHLWDGSNAASGVYIYRIEASSIGDAGKNFTQTEKMILIK